MATVEFELTPPMRLEPCTSASDRSATLQLNVVLKIVVEI
ncbi:hypothetical protein EVAR_88898_1, partial [Eumeta japonica]